MAKDPEEQSEYEDQDEREDEFDEEEEDEEEEEAVEAEIRDPNRPTCPRCGWHNTRLSHTRTLLDSVLRTFSLRAFRCRSCGNRFHTVRRVPKE